MTVTSNEFGQQNIFAKEPQMVVEDYNRKGLDSPQQYIEKYNGRWAMMGVVSGFLSYAITGKLFFGIFWDLTMVPFCFTITSIAFFVLLAYSVEQLSETY